MCVRVMARGSHCQDTWATIVPRRVTVGSAWQWCTATPPIHQALLFVRSNVQHAVLDTSAVTTVQVWQRRCSWFWVVT